MNSNKPRLGPDDPSERAKFTAIYGFTPTFIPCKRCSKPTTKSPCFECCELIESERERAATAKRQNLPTEYAWAILGTPLLSQRVKVGVKRPEDVAEAVKHFPGALVLFRGDSRTGKTSLAVAIARSIHGAVYMPSAELAKAPGQHPLGEGEAPKVRLAKRAPLLVVDELGGELPHLRDEVRAVIWEREQHGRKTILTTWMPLEKLQELYGSGLEGRLSEKKRALLIEFGATGGKT